MIRSLLLSIIFGSIFKKTSPFIGLKNFEFLLKADLFTLTRNMYAE